MASVNKVIIVGNLGKDPELKQTQAGKSFANFSVATTEKYKDQAGNQKEVTEWHRVTAWGKLAELCAQYLGKGRQVYLEGRIQTRKWEDETGQKRYSTEIVADSVKFLGSSPGNAPRSEGQPQVSAFEEIGEEKSYDDIPF